MKRYLLFIGNFFYPSGGWKLILSHHDSIEECNTEWNKLKADYNWAHIVDKDTMTIVRSVEEWH